MSTRDQYIEKFKAKLDEWNAEIDRLEARGRQAEADSRIKYEKELSDLREKRDAAREKLEEIQHSSDDAWQDLKRGADDAWSAARDALAQAAERFK